MNKKSSKIIWIIIVALAMAAVVGFYIYDVAFAKNPPTKNLFKVIIILVGLLTTLFKIVNVTGRKNSLAMYEKAYEDYIGYAFRDNPSAKKRLLRGARFYDENDYGKALKCLQELLSEAKTERDRVPVLLFMALCYDGGRMRDAAIETYCEILAYDFNHATAHNNLGMLYVEKGDYDRALNHYNKAIACKHDYFTAYNNRANYYFLVKDYDAAIADAKKALEIKNNMVQAATLLAIIYALRCDIENKNKYYHIAVTSGRPADEMDRIIDYYMNEAMAEEEELYCDEGAFSDA